MILDALPDLEALLGREQRDTLLRLAVTHGERSRGVLADALAVGDLARMKAEAHALRGAVAPFGAAGLQALLRRVESGATEAAAAVDAEVAAFVLACRAALG